MTRNKNNLKEEKQIWNTILPDFKLYYKVTVIKTIWYQHKNKHRSMEKNREPRNKLKPMWSIHLSQRSREYTVERRQSLHSINRCWEKLDRYVQKNENRPLSHTTYKDKFKGD